MTTARPESMLRRSASHPARLSIALLAAAAAACGAGPDAADPGGATSSARAGEAAAGAGTQVQVTFNHAPRLLALTGEQTFLIDAVGRTTMQARLRVEAADEDGDDLRFRWSAPGCPEASLTAAGGEVGGDEGGAEGAAPGAGSRSSVTLTGPADQGCVVEVEVRDAWKDGEPPPGAGPGVEKGGVALGRLQFAPAPRRL